MSDKHTEGSLENEHNNYEKPTNGASGLLSAATFSKWLSQFNEPKLSFCLEVHLLGV